MSDASKDQAPGAGSGLGATGTTADQFQPGDTAEGTTYGDPRGTDTESDELTERAQQDEENGTSSSAESSQA